MSKKFDFKEEVAYVICPYCKGKIQVLMEEENEEGEIFLVDDPDKRLEVVKAHFERCEKDNPYLDDPYATYPEE